MKITENWIGTVEKLQYKSIENKSKFTNTQNPIIYMCLTTISEIGRGLAKARQRHNVVFYLSQQQFDEKVIEKGDRVEIKSGAKWQMREIKYDSYKPDYIAKSDKTKLMRDENDRIFVSETLFCYKVSCKENDWGIKTKWYDRNYCTILNSRIRLPLEDKQQFVTNDSFNWFLDADEYKKLLEINDTTQEVLCYSDKTKIGQKTMLVHLTRDETNGTYELFLQGVAQ